MICINIHAYFQFLLILQASVLYYCFVQMYDGKKYCLHEHISHQSLV